MPMEEANAPVAAAAAGFKKLLGMGATLFRRGFRSSKCKTELKLATARIKLLRNRRESQIREMRRDVAMLLESGQDATARIRVEHVIREQNILAANEIIELFCEVVVVRLSIITKQRDCPADLREGICSLIFAAPRCSEIPELLRICDIFKKKYGKDFVAAATELRPDSGVNRLLIEKLSVRTPLGEAKLKVMKEIAKECQVEWDMTESENELLKPLDEKISGPRTFISAASVPVKSTVPQKDGSNQHDWRSYDDKEASGHPQGSISAAQAAAELAEKAVAVAHAAAHLARQTPCQVEERPSFCRNIGYPDRSSGKKNEEDTLSPFVNSIAQPNLTHSMSKLPDPNSNTNNGVGVPTDQDAVPMQMEDGRLNRYNGRVRDIDIKFDDSDCDDDEPETKIYDGESHDGRRGGADDFDTTHTFDKNSWVFPMRLDNEEVNHPSQNRPPAIPSSDLDDRICTDNCIVNKADQNFRVHPKLPDYEKLAARFEALKLRRFS